MASRHSNIALNTSTAVEITGITDTTKRNGVTIVLNNNHATSIMYFGATSSVSTTDFGFHLDPNARVVLSGMFDYTDKLYAICSTGTPSVHVLVIGG